MMASRELKVMDSRLRGNDGLLPRAIMVTLEAVAVLVNGRIAGVECGRFDSP